MTNTIDETSDDLTLLQSDALFYRHPSGHGSQGGYDNLFAGTSNLCPYADWSDREKAVWLSHWNHCNNLPDIVKSYITGDLSIKALGDVTDLPESYTNCKED